MKCLDYNIKRNLKRQFTLDNKKLLSEKEYNELKELGNELSEWFKRQYILYNVFDRIQVLKIERIHFEKKFLNRLDIYKSFITFTVVLVNSNKERYCHLYLNDIFHGTYTKSDFSLCKVRWL